MKRKKKILKQNYDKMVTPQFPIGNWGAKFIHDFRKQSRFMLTC